MKKSFANRIYLLAILAILIPLIIGLVFMGYLLNDQFNHEYHSRMNANLETMNLIYNNEITNLIKGVKGLSTDNTLIQTLQLNIAPQLVRYISTKRRVLNLSDIFIADSNKTVLYRVLEDDSLAADSLLAQCIIPNMFKIIKSDTVAKILYSREIRNNDQIIGYISGTYNLLSRTNLGKFHKKIQEPFAIWINDELLTTNFDTSVTIPSFDHFQENKNFFRFGDLLLVVKEMRFRPDIFRFGIILSTSRTKLTVLKYVLYMFLSTIAIFLLILFILSKYIQKIIQPVNHLASVAYAIEKGEEVPNMPEFDTDEFNYMSTAFKNMVEKLKESEKNLKIHRDQLQELVNERTRELKFINNELRMVISEQEKTAGELKVQKDNFALLSDTAMELLDLPPEENIYDFICKKMHSFLENGIVSISTINTEADSFTIESIAGIGNKLNAVTKFLGVNPVGYSAKGFSLIAEVFKQKALLDLTNEPILKKNKFVSLISSDPAQKIMNIQVIYGIPLHYANKITAIFILALPHEINEKTRKMVMSFTDQASTAILRRKSEAELQRSENRYRNIFLNAPVGIYRTTPEGRIEMANEALIKMLGYKNLEDLQTVNLEGLAEYDRKQYISKLKANRDTMIGYETLWTQKNGQKIHIRENSHAYYNDQKELIYLEGTVEDISRQKETEKMLKEAVKAAEYANRAKSEFLANMSHEIRTPLNAIIGFSELLTGMISDPVQNSYVSSIKTSGKSLLTLINDILDLSKIEAGKFSIEYDAVNLRDILREIELIFQKNIADKNLGFSIQFSEEMPEYLMMDETRLRQVLINIVGNAIKFTEEGLVRISAGISNPQGNKVDLEIAVTDSGIGIPLEDISSIFESFKQKEGQSNRRYGGTGLGLSISKKLIEMMNGKIYVESLLGKGSTFTVSIHEVEIPQDKIMREKGHFINFENIRFTSKKILIVDDVPSNLDLLEAYLENINQEVVKAINGEEAILLAERSKPDLIIMDMLMPIVDGLDATIILKQMEETKSIPVVALTASPMVKGMKVKDQTIFDAHLDKPISKDSLYELLLKFIPHENIEKETPALVSKDKAVKSKGIYTEELKQVLIDKFLPRTEDLIRSMILTDIVDFAGDIENLGATYQSDYVVDYGAHLKALALQFDIGNVDNWLGNFNDLIKKL
ncbi:MAG: response regulator [Candidatus Marinimicrobia bacterium]|nr:response regulator [Candidatus Neomarinimicrobiota bacterium]